MENREGDEKVPEGLLCCEDAGVVCKWLCCFVQETRKENGERYPPSTIRSLLSAFQRVMQSNNLSFRLFEKSDLRFRELRNTLDAVCVSLRKEGVGATRSHAAVISAEDERTMWASTVLGTENPWALARAVFFVVGTHFSLRGGQEHRDLTLSQFRRVPSDGAYSKESYYEYIEHGSKNYQGKFTESESNKVVSVHSQPAAEYCPVKILDLYISKLPSNPKAFYMQPLLNVPVDPAQPWYQCVPIGINPLKNMMPRISELAGLATRYTNHSLMATAATRMFTAGVPEKIISEFTGHRSSKALHQYERTSTGQIQAAGLAISSETPFSPHADRMPLTAQENTKLGDEDKKPDIKKALPTFTGLTNCTINISL